MTTPRGIRNLNPLNIRRTSTTQWQGVAEVQRDREFVTFKSMRWGIRAHRTDHPTLGTAPRRKPHGGIHPPRLRMDEDGRPAAHRTRGLPHPAAHDGTRRDGAVAPRRGLRRGLRPLAGNQESLTPNPHGNNENELENHPGRGASHPPGAAGRRSRGTNHLKNDTRYGTSLCCSTFGFWRSHLRHQPLPSPGQILIYAGSVFGVKVYIANLLNRRK